MSASKDSELARHHDFVTVSLLLHGGLPGPHLKEGHFVSQSALWVLLIMGGTIGWYIGRWRAENKRARFDMDKTWRGRKDYRDG